MKRLLGIRRECEQFIIYEKEGEDGSLYDSGRKESIQGEAASL